MLEWTEFALALAAFLVSHAVPVRPPVRPWLVARLGQGGYLWAYSLLSLLVLGWLILAAARAPYVELIPAWPLLRWVPAVAMAPACLLVVLGLSAVNPFSFGGFGHGRFDPQAPGVLAVTRHPLLLAMAIWAAAHLLANGTLAHGLLFGLFAGFAVMGMALIDRRKARQLPDWRRLAQNTARLSVRAVPALRPRPLHWAAAVLLYLTLLALHPQVIGASPLP